jgi:hypothetical protein
MPSYSRSILLLALVALLAPTRAHASPVENFFELQIGPGDAQHMLLRYINGGGGMFLSSDGGESWKLHCDGAMLDPLATVIGPTAVLENSLFALASTGMYKADVDGCGWKLESRDRTQSIKDFIVHPGDSAQLIAVRGEVKGSEQHGGLLRRAADGVWSDLGTPDDRYPVSLRATQVDGKLRIYEIASLPASDADAGSLSNEYVIRVSDDEGKSFREHALQSSDGFPQVRAIDPTNPDRVVVVLGRIGSPDDVLVSSDQGESFKPYVQVTTFNQIVFGKGGEVWIADMGVIDNASSPKGLWHAKSLSDEPTRVSDYPAQCLGYRAKDDTLFACQHFWFGSVDQADGTFQTKMKMSTVKDFVQCSGEDPVAECQEQLCVAYCGSGHFAVAPVCWSYNTDTCGLPVAKSEGALDSSGAAGDGAAGKSAAGSGGKGAAGAGGRSATAGNRAVAGSSAAAGSGGTSPTSSGCSCELSAAPRTGDSRAAFALGLLTLALVRVRRRARAQSLASASADPKS